MVELVDIPERRKQIPPQSSDLPAAFGFESNEENNFGSNIELFWPLNWNGDEHTILN